MATFQKFGASFLKFGATFQKSRGPYLESRGPFRAIRAHRYAATPFHLEFGIWKRSVIKNLRQED